MITQMLNNQTGTTGLKHTNCINHRNSSFDDGVVSTSQNNSAVITVLTNGMILACNKACGELLGVEPERLAWQPISRLLPQLADISLILDQKINPYLKFLSVAGHRFDVVSTNGRHVACELFFSVVDDFGRCCLQITMKPFRQKQGATLRHLRAY